MTECSNGFVLNIWALGFGFVWYLCIEICDLFVFWCLIFVMYLLDLMIWNFLAI